MTQANQPPINPPAATNPLSDAAHHRPPDDHEIIYYEGSPQLRSQVGHLLAHAVLAIVLVAAPIFYHFMRRDRAWPVWWVTIALLVIALILIAVPWIRIHTVRYRISNYRIDFE